MSSKKPKSNIDRVLEGLAKVANILGMVTLVAMMLMTVTDVILRYFFNRPISGGTEVTELMMVCLFLGVPLCTLKGQAIKMELIVGKFPKRAQGLLDALTDTIGLITMLFLTWTLIEEMQYAYEFDIQSVVLKISTFPFYGILAFSVGLLCLMVFRIIIQNIIKGVKA